MGKGAVSVEVALCSGIYPNDNTNLHNLISNIVFFALTKVLACPHLSSLCTKFPFSHLLTISYVPELKA